MRTKRYRAGILLLAAPLIFLVAVLEKWQLYQNADQISRF